MFPNPCSRRKIKLIKHIIDVFGSSSDRARRNKLNILINSYYRFDSDFHLYYTPLMFAAELRNKDMVELFTSCALESPYFLSPYPVVWESTAFQILLHAQPNHIGLFYLWFSGAVVKLKNQPGVYSPSYIPDGAYSPLSIPAIYEGCIDKLWVGQLWMEYLLTKEEYYHINEPYRKNQKQEKHVDERKYSTPYLQLLKIKDQKAAIDKRLAEVNLKLLLNAGADKEGMLPIFNEDSKLKDNEIEFTLLSLCREAKLKKIEAVLVYFEEQGIKIDFSCFDETPAFIAAIQGRIINKHNALQVLDLLFNYNKNCAKFSCRSGTMAVTQAAKQGDFEVLKKLIQEYKLPVNPVHASQNPPVLELLTEFVNRKVSPLNFKTKGMGKCLELLIQSGSDVEMPFSDSDMSTREYIMHNNLLPDTNTDQIPGKILLSYPILISQIRANPRQAFFYCSFLHYFCSDKEDEMNIFNKKDTCQTIADYVAVYPDPEVKSILGGPGSIFVPSRSKLRQGQEPQDETQPCLTM